MGLLAQGTRHRRAAGSEAGHLYAALASSGSESDQRSRRMAARRWMAARAMFTKRFSFRSRTTRWKHVAPQDDVHQLKYIPSVGVESGFWWGELLSDPRPVDAFSLVYDSAPLKTELAILGRPHALLQASATAPLADWFARLSDVAPDGTVTQITGAGINGAQRESMAEPRDLEPGKFYALDITMHLTSWVFPAGHRIRLAISNALWPMILPTPYAMTTSLELGSNGSRLTLPVVPGARRRGSSVPTAATFGGTQGHHERWLSLARRVDARARRSESESDGALEGQSRNQLSLGKGNRLRESGLQRGRRSSRNQRGSRRSGKHFCVKGSRAQMARTFIRDHRPEEFLLQVHARAAERRSDGEAEDVGRNDSPRPPMKF